MAGDWIKIRLDLDEDPAVIGIVERTGLDLDCVLGKLFRCWRWFNRQSRNGHAAVTLASLDRYLNASGFTQAMAEVGWLETDAGGNARIPKFDRHNSKSAKKRALAAMRQQVARAQRQRDGSVTGALPEKRREEKNTPLPPEGEVIENKEQKPRPCILAEEIPAALDTPAFRAAWTAYAQHCLAKRAPLSEEGGRKLLRRLAKWSGAEAIDALDYTMEKNWVGVKERPLGEKTDSLPPETPAQRDERIVRQRQQAAAKRAQAAQNRPLKQLFKEEADATGE